MRHIYGQQTKKEYLQKSERDTQIQLKKKPERITQGALK